ncbi:MAG: DNA polymerase III subunit gamma/tau, partial [bacterium]
MNHETLYRKYRPQKFSEVINQDDVVSLLENSISEERIAHAYIFSGGRGTGKTSVARILAKEIGTTDDDLYEIDAASNRGIDDIRALRETIETLPFSSPKKVYLIDEAHMLTREAWNALLKTLEEPPKHVIFILATTELEKIPETIQSRCQVCEFKKPTRAILSKAISKIAKKEGFDIEEESSDLISLMANGSFRDAIGALQKTISLITGKAIKLSDTERSLGAPKESLIEKFIVSTGKKDTENALKALNDAKVNEMNME